MSLGFVLNKKVIGLDNWDSHEYSGSEKTYSIMEVCVPFSSVTSVTITKNSDGEAEDFELYLNHEISLGWYGDSKEQMWKPKYSSKIYLNLKKLDSVELESVLSQYERYKNFIKPNPRLKGN